ncbi:MAG: hypothetical protein MMC33_004306 [Icmadophila ericetorum]|nr:hypothetical protein [Icmadophila ericetorum]
MTTLFYPMMNNNYYTPYPTQGDLLDTSENPDGSDYTESLPQEGLTDFDLATFQASQLQYGGMTYPSQGYSLVPPGGPGRSSAATPVGSAYEYFAHEGIEMPESQRTIQKERRKAQNRASQKAFRHRKEARIKELEQNLETLEKNHSDLKSDFDKLKREKDELQAQNDRLAAENVALRSGTVQSGIPRRRYGQ